MILCALGIFILLIIIYSFLIEPNLISLNSIPITDNRLFEVFHDKKVVQISDLHIKSIGYREKKLIKMLNRVNPDILFITGDFITHDKYGDSCIKFLKQIVRPSYGIWAVLGNADRNGFNGRIKGFVKRLEHLEIKVLENSYERLFINESGRHVFIVGVEGPYLSRSKLNWIMRDIPDNSPVVLLSHYPNVLKKDLDALVINLEEAEVKGIPEWKWQISANFEYDQGIVRFEKTGSHKLRVQSREKGVRIEQICLVASTNDKSLFHASSNNSYNETSISKATNSGSEEMIIISAEDIPDSNIYGSWKKIRDESSDCSLAIKDIPDSGRKNNAPLLEPKNYFEVDFYARGSVDYQVWVRMKAENESISDASVYIQFSDSTDQLGESIYKIGELYERNELKRINLILAGHTHGGQIRFPIFGAIDGTPFHNISPYHEIVFAKGLFESEGTKMYVNRGIGTAFLPMRILCSPEITVFKFTEVEKIFKNDRKS